MYDMFPFPQTTPSKPIEGQMAEIVNYLIQFKETLEFILMNISTDNLSQELVDKLNSLGADVTKNNADIDEQVQQVSQSVKSLTVSDVINSEAFKIALEREYKFTVNFETGNLDYIKS